jgi:hypothetical protein
MRWAVKSQIKIPLKILRIAVGRGLDLNAASLCNCVWLRDGEVAGDCGRDRFRLSLSNKGSWVILRGITQLPRSCKLKVVSQNPVRRSGKRPLFLLEFRKDPATGIQLATTPIFQRAGIQRTHGPSCVPGGIKKCRGADSASAVGWLFRLNGYGERRVRWVQNFRTRSICSGSCE